ncbi:MAG: MATE family efflux transporter [Oscillibacter sp.]|jgi:putative MATE family efflux protein|nr:MATE family efflux transporter [Oscillibacter sp.]
MTQNMTVGSPFRHILRFAAPMLLGMLFQQFYNMMDSVIVGRLLGSDALAAVGSTGSISFLVIGFCMGICSGFAIPVAQSFGAGDYSRMRRFVGNSIWLGAVSAIVLTGVTMLLCRSILTWMQTPSDIFEDAFRYIFLIFAGIPATILYNLVSGIIRSLGDSRTPVIFLAVSSVLNIVLDVVFIMQFHSGVAGAAWATIIAQAVSGLLCLIYAARHCPVLRLSREELKYNPRMARTLWGMGLPMGLQYSITAIGCAVLQAFLNQLGTDAVAASTVGNKLGQLFCCPFDALGSTMATYCGQNVGAGKVDRLQKGMNSAGIIGSIYALLALGVMLLWAPQLSLLFLKADQTYLVSMSTEYMIAQAAFYVPLTYLNNIRFGIQGMGFTQLAILAGVLEMVARTAVGFLLVPRFGYLAACLGSPVAWIAADLFLFPAAHFCIKKLRRTLSPAPESPQPH